MCLQDDPTGVNQDIFHLLITECITKKIKPAKSIMFDAMHYMLSKKYPTQLQINVMLKLFSTGIPLDVKNSFGDTPLTTAATFNSMVLVEMLLSAGANVHEADNAEQTAWFNARIHDNKEMQELLLSYVCASPSLAATTLFDAVKFDDLDTVKYLVSRGVDPCVVLSMGAHPFERDRTCLTNACSSLSTNFAGKVRIVSYLIELYKNKNQLHLLNKTSEDETALMMVVNHEVKISRYTRGTRNSDTATPEEKVEKLKLVKLLLEAGAKPDLPDCWNNTPLMAAVYNNEFDCVQALLTAKANANAANNDGLTPLMLAAEAADNRILKSLVKAGAKLDAKDHNGDTALIAAADLGNLEAVNTLITAGASIEIINEQGDSALDIAQFHGNEEIVKALEAAAAKPSVKKFFGRLFSHSNDENSRNGSISEADRTSESDLGFDF
jgi:ankyrin repeat protein